MREYSTIERAHKDAREGKSASTQAGEFVREEFHHIRHGKHGARSPQQAIAIGLSKARRAGISLPPPKRGETSDKVRSQAERDLAKGTQGDDHVSAKRSRGVTRALRREGHEAASTQAISRHATASASRRTSRERTMAAQQSARTKTRDGLAGAGRKAARTRAEHEMS